ncbi:MAG: LysR family transcriptional regulator [Lachnospiraceae bacterium]
MKPMIRIFLCDEENKRFFGEGPCRLLHAIEETGSLRSASLSMEMAYTKALQLIRNAERELGFPLTVRKTGGKGGGGSCLTRKQRSFCMNTKPIVMPALRPPSSILRAFQNSKKKHLLITGSRGVGKTTLLNSLLLLLFPPSFR